MSEKKSSVKQKLFIAGFILLPVFIACGISAMLVGKSFPLQLIPGTVILFLAFQLFLQFKILRILFLIAGSVALVLLVISHALNFFLVSPVNVLFLYAGLLFYFTIVLCWFFVSRRGPNPTDGSSAR